MVRYTEEELLYHKLLMDSYSLEKQEYFDYIFKNIDECKEFNFLLTPFDFYGKTEIYELSFCNLNFDISYHKFDKPIEFVYYIDSNKERKLKINYKPNEEKIIKNYDKMYLTYKNSNSFAYLYTCSFYNYLFDTLEDLKIFMNYIIDRKINDIQNKRNS